MLVGPAIKLAAPWLDWSDLGEAERQSAWAALLEGEVERPFDLERGPLVLTVSTSGVSPTLSALIKSRLEGQFGPEWAAWTTLFGEIRHLVQRQAGEAARMEAVERVLASGCVRERILAGDDAGAVEEAQRCISPSPA